MNEASSAPHLSAPTAPPRGAWVAAALAMALASGCRVSGDSRLTDAQLPDAGPACAEELRRECLRAGLACVPGLGCARCVPGTIGCDPSGAPARCADDGTWRPTAERCEAIEGGGCEEGRCVDLCELAVSRRSYEGCELYAVDLDSYGGASLDASRQQFAVIVSNPSTRSARVRVEVEDGPIGGASAVRTVASADIAPSGLQVFELPRREVDGSSERGSNDGTHTALTSAAFRIVSTVPVIAYQFNPLVNEGRFSADASLLLPSSALGTRYTVVGWPQCFGPGPVEDGSEQIRAFVTIVGTAPGTEVTVTMGPGVRRVAGGSGLEPSRAGDVVTVTLDAFDVLNLETARRGGDFSGTRVEASAPVAVFSGNESADVPFYEDPALRTGAADHLEEQLPPDAVLGRAFAIALQPQRTRAVSSAMASPPFAVVEEPEWLRLVSAEERAVNVRTTLEAPYDAFTVEPGETVTIVVRQNAWIEADGKLSAMQFLAGQELVGIPFSLPGGDPSSLVVPALEQLRDRYALLTPFGFAFDFVSVVAPATASVRLDGTPVEMLGCETEPLPTLASTAPYVVHRCQLSFPSIGPAPGYVIDPSRQADGVHVVESDLPVGVSVYGFDQFISYAYPGGLDLRPLD